MHFPGEVTTKVSFLVYRKKLISPKEILAPIYNSYKFLSMILNISPVFSTTR